MKQTLDDRYFDLTMKVLNYAIEFLNTPGYSSLRLMDLLDSLVILAPEIEGVKSNFYLKIGEKLNNRRVMSTQQDRNTLLNDILELYVEEWRKNK